MDVLVPTPPSDTNNGKNWEKHDIPILKNNTEKLELYFSLIKNLSERTSEIDLDLQAKIIELSSMGQQIKNTNNEIEHNKSMLYFGFLALLIVTIGTVMTFLYFIYENTKTTEFINNKSKEFDYLIINQLNYIKDLDKTTDIVDNNNKTIDCLRNKGYIPASCFIK
ncbi:hypothetical protein M0Q50_07500 [bacterium]|jgi:hypothetical protein|nr:hypothetical protein [bacterium]